MRRRAPSPHPAASWRHLATARWSSWRQQAAWLDAEGNQPRRLRCEARRAPWSPATPTGGLKKLKSLQLGHTQITDAGCATLVAAINSGALPALKELWFEDIPASDAAKDAVAEALARSRQRRGLTGPWVFG